MKVYCTSELYNKLPNVNMVDSNSPSLWHATLFRFERREHLLFTENETRFSLCLPNMKKKAYDNLSLYFFGEFIYSFEFYGYLLDQKTIDWFGGLDCTDITKNIEIFEYQQKLIKELPLLIQQPMKGINPSWLRLQLNRRVDFWNGRYQSPEVAWREKLASLGMTDTSI